MTARRLHLPITKNGDPLILPLSEFLANLLTLRRLRDPFSPFVFPGTGRTGHIGDAKSVINRVIAKSGVQFMLHDLRRTFITIAESLDIPAYALKALLNHRMGNDVTGGYIVMDAERLRVPVERIAEKIRKLANAIPSEKT